ncbi:benzoate transporter BenE [Rhodococcus rhodnii]|uniref:Benzoate membrane transport protein BenE n=2 Tax=Rhodococcus rhodnii TaxID=38312 RepID=R7WI80_9NOCA|nr:benzoate/H(+) symporter BenE family transporter [Rhodococcus rhodnii]EOM74902.1 benzoate membrane transport protein BenE [Rhodococcus rhodnii LMG 5362]TXG91655.1 benzoate transporter BenE [Rhodococcus rhodnii]
MTTREDERDAIRVPASAGIVAALVGFTSSFAVVLTGLRAVGADEAQATSGLIALCFAQALGMLWLARRYRQPITLAWSTPGAALLASAGAVEGGWPAAVGAFVVTGVAIVATGLIPALGRAVGRIPVPLAQAMLAGVLLPLCLAPVFALRDSAAATVPVLVVWLVLARFAPRWAVPGAFAAAAAVVAVAVARGDASIAAADLVASIELTAPTWTWQAIVGIALPLYIVTMASQNIPGTAVMASFGYRVPWRASMLTTGAGTVLGAFAGGHAVNLAAISAALAAGPAAGRDPQQRWIAGIAAGVSYLVIGAGAAAFAAVVVAAPDGVVAAVAGVALLATLANALSAALADESDRVAAVVTFVVAASGVAVLGVGSAFWALVIGLAVRWFLAPRPTRSREKM